MVQLSGVDLLGGRMVLGRGNSERLLHCFIRKEFSYPKSTLWVAIVANTNHSVDGIDDDGAVARARH